MTDIREELRSLLISEMEAEKDAEDALLSHRACQLIDTGDASFATMADERNRASIDTASARVREGDYLRTVPCPQTKESARVDRLLGKSDNRCLEREGEQLVFRRPLRGTATRHLLLPPAPFLDGYDALATNIDRILAAETTRALTQSPSTPFDPAWLSFDECERQLIEDTRLVQLVQGPPGCGKTHLIAGLALEVARRGGSVLVAAYTHRALRQVVEAITRRRRTDDAPPAYRESDASAVPIGASQERHLPAGSAFRGRILLCTATRIAMSWRTEPNEGSWDLVIVDEASQLLLPFLLGSAALGRRAVVVGDPNQLPPVIKKPENQHREVADALRWVSERTTGLAMRENRRFNAPLCDFVSSHFYDGRLKPIDVERGGQRTRLLDAVPGGQEGCRWILYRGDQDEAEIVVSSLLEVDAKYGGRSPFEPRVLRYAVATPRREHVARLLAAFQRAPSLRGRVVVETVDRLQGETVDVVCFSPGERLPTGPGSERDLSWTLSSRRLNVALSRGRYLASVVAAEEYAQMAASLANPEGESRRVWGLVLSAATVVTPRPNGSTQ